MSTILLAHLSAYEVQVSHECNEGGTGHCDGYDYTDSQLGETCECPCHEALDLPLTTQGILAYHQAMHEAAAKELASQFAHMGL